MKKNTKLEGIAKKNLPIIETVLFTNISEHNLGMSRPSTILPLLIIIEMQNGLNLNKPREYKIANNILKKSVKLN